MNFLILAFFALLAPLQAVLPQHKDYPHVQEEAWHAVEPYLMPLNHKVKPQLDKLFANPRVLLTIDDFKQAGFKVIRYRSSKKLVVARHRKLKNYLVKAYLEDNSHVEWRSWVHRAKGAAYIQNVLDEHHLNGYFKVPHKWIYPIKKTALGPHPKYFVMLVEDMGLMTKEESLAQYKKASRHFVKKLFEGIDKTGYRDCHIDNIPFSYDGRVALIDLEYYNSEVTFDKVECYLSRPMKKYWKEMVKARTSAALVHPSKAASLPKDGPGHDRKREL